MESENKKCCGLEKTEPQNRSYGEREPKIFIEGIVNYSFGKNGQGLTDEFLKIGEVIKAISKDNYVFIEEAFIDACDDVYSLQFRITPHEENKWAIKEYAVGNKINEM